MTHHGRRTPTLELLVALSLVLTPTVLAQEIPDPTSASPRNEGVDITGRVTSRDNTRVVGTVYDYQGNPLPRVDVWVTNDRAPANRMRVRTRASGHYLVRGMDRLYTRDDIYGIVLRLRFESEGYQPMEAKIAVKKNELGELYPILWPEGEDPMQMSGWCVRLEGKITDSRGKKVKNATVEVSSPEDPTVQVETTAGKDGSYEAVVWSAPASLTVRAAADGFEEVEDTFTLEGQKRHDLVATVERHLSLSR